MNRKTEYETANMNPLNLKKSVKSGHLKLVSKRALNKESKEVNTVKPV